MTPFPPPCRWAWLGALKVSGGGDGVEKVRDKFLTIGLNLGTTIAHGVHPVLRWMMDNIFIRSDPAGNIKPDKEKSTEKIDGAVATIMAPDRAIRYGNDNGASVYDSRGLLFI